MNKKTKSNKGDVLGVTVLGAMPYEQGKRMVAITEYGPVWGKSEPKGSLGPGRQRRQFVARLKGQ